MGPSAQGSSKGSPGGSSQTEPMHIKLLLIGCLLLCGAAAAGNPMTTLSLQSQAEDIPAEFADRLFNSPQASRVELNGVFLGDALLALGRDGSVQLLQFSDLGPGADTLAQGVWQAYLAEPKPLGECRENCPDGLLSMHYSVENATLYLLSRHAETGRQSARFLRQPDGGSQGLIARSQLNLAGGAGGASGGRYALDMSGSVGNWTGSSGLLVSKNGGEEDGWQHSLTQLYGQREYAGHFLRLGYFSPDSQQMVLLPRALDGMDGMTLGMMAGSSDTLSASRDYASSYPIYVTANRDGMVEVLRNGVLLHSQAVASGLQLVNTRTLPEGVYQVEVRVMRDGVVQSTQTEWVYKPPSWGDPEQRLRYNVFAGRQRNLLDNLDAPGDGQLVLGGSVNYLLHPQVVTGLNAQRSGDRNGVGASAAVDFSRDLKLSGNWFHSSLAGNGADVQLHGAYHSGSVLVSLSQGQQTLADGSTQPVRSAAVTWQQQLGANDNLTARVANSSGVGNGLGLDLGLNRRQKLWGSDATLRLSVFDRPYGGVAGARNRGAELSLNLDFARTGRSVSASVGSRSSGQGARDRYASVTLRQSQESSWLQQYSLGLSADRYGLGGSGDAQWRHPLAQGDAYLSRSSQGGGLSGGVNLESTLAFSGQAVAISAEGLASGIDTGVIVDVASDVPGVVLHADDSAGGSYALHGGRNLLPVTPYRAGKLSFYFQEKESVAANISPAQTAYHLNKGGVGYAAVEVRQIVTLAGRLQDAAGRPLSGAAVINHAGRTISDADGFFSLDVSARQPELEVRVEGRSWCRYQAGQKLERRDGDLIYIGEIRCLPDKADS
ncbi:pilus assembly protein PapC [Xenophilus sp. AP218F]|nr:pilus assembly protein PapC [Xenophilus sp. AP218F]